MESKNKTKKIFVIIVLVLSFIPLILFIIYYLYSDEVNSALGIKKDDLKEEKEKIKGEKNKDKKTDREIACSIRNEMKNYVLKNQCIPECKKIKDDKIRKVCINLCKANKMVPFDKKEILINEIEKKDPLVFLHGKMNPINICKDKNCKKYSNSSDKQTCSFQCFIQSMCKRVTKLKYVASKKQCIPECEKNKDYINDEGDRVDRHSIRKSCIDDCRSYQ